MIKCTFTPKNFRLEMSERAFSISGEDLSDAEIRNALYQAVQDISKSMGLTGSTNIEEAIKVVEEETEYYDDAQKLDTNEIRAAINEWKNPRTSEDTTADHLSKDNERINDDPFESNYGSALYAKIRAKQQANRIGVLSILYNSTGIINSTNDLNNSIRVRQEELLLKVISYLKTRVSSENQAKFPEVFENGKMYINGEYSGIVERISELYSSILRKENFDTRMLNKYYNNENFDILDAYNSWIILNNFDTILLTIFGKAIAINPDAAKYSTLNKYSIAGGSNVYTTWRTSDEIDLSKEINNISLAIITNIPFITRNSTTPSLENLKFNEFIYIIGKIKTIPDIAENDWKIEFNVRSNLSEELLNKYSGKSILELINNIRTNPQETLPDLFQLLNNEDIIESLVANRVIDKNTFLDIDKDIINSVYKGLFDSSNRNSLYSILNTSGFDGINYFAFVAQTIDSTFKSSFLQYFRNPQGEIYMRNMYDQSISNMEYAIRDSINSVNSQLFILDYDSIKKKYNITESTRTITQDGEYNITYNGTNYTFKVEKGLITWGLNNSTNLLITNPGFLSTLTSEYLKIPESVSFIINDYYKGPLKVTVSLLNGNINYEVNGDLFNSFTSAKDYMSLSGIIQEILKLNLNLDNKYYEAYKNRFGEGNEGTMTTNLMSLVSRVITNLYISTTQLKGLTPIEVRNKINTIYGDQVKPTYDNKLGEIRLLTEADTRAILQLAEAKAQATGRLTSSQLLDSNGNALASSSLSRLMSVVRYLYERQIKLDWAAAKGFSLWSTGVFKGIQQMKEVLDNSEDTSKSAIEFSNSEMEYSSIFVDFFLSLFGSPNTKSPLQNGITAFLPSENSDKPYIGRMLVDLSKIKVGEESLYDILSKDLTRITEFTPIIQKELGEFYTKALDNINAEWKRVENLLKTIDPNIAPISYNNWDSVNTLAKLLGLTPEEFLRLIITKHNNENPQDLITLIDLVHCVFDKNGNITPNISFLENVSRFKDIRKLQGFISQQNIEVVKELLKDKLDVPIENVPGLKEKLGDLWIDSRTGKVILAKVTGPMGGLVVNIRRSSDLSKLDLPNTNIVVNPLIVAYNTLNYFFTQEFMGSTVGMFYAHPSKDKTGNPLMDEKSRKAAQDKRNVSFTAAMHSFLKNLLQGIPDIANIAIMPDPRDSFLTISGDMFEDIKPFDGATFENPFFGRWENNSLGGAKVGTNKKTFTHFYDERTGTGGIIKTANFSLTNDSIRRSKFYQRMIQNMTDRKWRNLDGTDFVTDITRDYNGNRIAFTNPTDRDGQLYFRKVDKEGNTHYYRINAIKNLGENLYQRYLQEVDTLGRITNEEFIEKDALGNEAVYLVNTNYSLWNLFGGAYAMEMREGDRFLQFTENSINLVANIANKVGNKIRSIIKTQADLYLPLKHSDIHLMPTIGAVKLGAANINNMSSYNVSDPNAINFMRIRLDLSGILLDKEHHADNEDLSIMTLVLSACAARGYTEEQSHEMYNALASLARAGIKEYLDSFNEFFLAVENENASELEKLEASNKYQEVILDTLIEALAHSTNNDSTLAMVTQELLNKAKEGKLLTFKEKDSIPYSDPSVFRKLHSTIAVAMTRGAIKIKVSGVLSVLCPSYGIVKLYGDRTLSNYNNDAQILALQTLRDNDPIYEYINNFGRIQIGRTYKLKRLDETIELRTIKTQSDYYRLKNEIQNYTSIKELFAPMPEMNFEGGRDLAAYNATFRGVNSLKTFNIYDLASVRRLSDLKELKASREDIDLALREVLLDLNKLHQKNGLLLLDSGSVIELDPNSVDILPYEIVMPKIFATVFGLETSDDLNEIKDDKDFFTRRLIERVKPLISNSAYSIGLMNVSGRHIYLLNRNLGTPQELTKKTILLYSDKKKLWRVRSGEKMYLMLKGDEIYEYRSPDGIVQEVIVTDNPNFYVNNLKFSTISISKSADSSKIISDLYQFRKKFSVRNYLEALDIARAQLGSKNMVDAVQNITVENFENSPLKNYFQNMGKELHTSFLKSLEVVAARIPAQSMLSFMPMKVVAFETPDINTAYVSTTLLLFQGSDFDIDSVSLASYSFDKSGKYILHSPFAVTDSIENLRASENLPFPTGKVLEVNTNYTVPYTNLIELGIINPNKPFFAAGTEVRLNLESPQAINTLGLFIQYVNKLGYIPNAEEESLKPLIEQITEFVNQHNDYINDDSAEEFAKNYVVSSMYKIGLSPANLIESQQAMDSITGPLKDVANETVKALDTSLDNPGSFITNIHGIKLNMDGKKGVGICAVGLKSFFALTARYNDVLSRGSAYEQERLRSNVTIAGKLYLMLANAYGTKIATEAMAKVISELSNQDLALILSGLLSLATDNAKELALSKLNAANMLGMYIYGITIGMDFKTLADIICSKTGIIINEMMESNSFTKKRGMSIQNIYDYLETAPDLTPELPLGAKLSDLGIEIVLLLSQESLYKLSKTGTPNDLFAFLETLKDRVDKEIVVSYEKQALHRTIEDAEEYLQRVSVINSELEIYEDFKKLNEGGEELRRLGQLLHINQGLETSYSRAITYIDTVTSVISDREYSKYRLRKRNAKRMEYQTGNKIEVQSPKDIYKFDFHQFVSNQDYRDAWIDIYGGIVNEEKYTNSEVYRNQFIQVIPSLQRKSIENGYEYAVKNLKPSKVFFNVLDTMQVPHLFAYLQSADMLHQAMLKTSAKYRAIVDLGKLAIDLLGAFSASDKENIYRRTELLVDRIMRDRWLLSKSLEITIPKGVSYFVNSSEVKLDDLDYYSSSIGLKKIPATNSNTTIVLGTRAGNASFKLLMELKIIPNLQRGLFGQGNTLNTSISENDFIKSLSLVLYKQNPLYNVTINYAPNINMSPRSDSEKALFEKLKFAFNEFRYGHLGDIRYTLGNESFNIMELFYYYNMIAFNGRPGENTLTSIFLDVLDYKVIKEFRDFENSFDKAGVIDITKDSLIKEVAPRANPWSTHLNNFYYENPNTGKLSYWSRSRVIYDPDTGRRVGINMNGYSPTELIWASSEDYKNYVNNSASTDIQSRSLSLSTGDSATISFNQGSVSNVRINSKENGEYNLTIPTKYKENFDNPPVTYILDENGNRLLGYDLDALTKYIEQVITCG